MTYETILLERNQAVATITLNRPKLLNAFNRVMRKELFNAVTELENDNNINVVIIKGSGAGFSAGADLTEGASLPISDQIDYEYKPVLEKIYNGKKLYIAQIHKNASGAGAGLALACDFLVMDEKATLYLAFAAIALVPDCGTTWQLLHAMGRRRALSSMLECEFISAQDCLTYGLANKVVNADELNDVTMQWAEKLAKAPNDMAAATKRLLNQSPFVSLSDAISLEAQEQNQLIVSDDFKNAVAKFMSKKK